MKKQNLDMAFGLDEIPDPTDLELAEIENELIDIDTVPLIEEYVYEGNPIDYSTLSFRAERIA